MLEESWRPTGEAAAAHRDIVLHEYRQATEWANPTPCRPGRIYRPGLPNRFVRTQGDERVESLQRFAALQRLAGYLLGRDGAAVQLLEQLNGAGHAHGTGEFADVAKAPVGSHITCAYGPGGESTGGRETGSFD